MMASNPVFVKMSVLSGMSASVRLFQVSSHFQELANHIFANSLAYQRLSAKVKQSNGFRDNDRTEFLQNATEAHKARCPNVHNLEVCIFNFWSNTNWSVLQIINKQNYYKSGLEMPYCIKCHIVSNAMLVSVKLCTISELTLGGHQLIGNFVVVHFCNVAPGIQNSVINIAKGTTDPRVEFISQVAQKSWSNFIFRISNRYQLQNLKHLDLS